VFISHDVHFIKTLANKVIHVAGGKLTPYLGDYQFYLHKTQAQSARAALTAGGAGGKGKGKGKSVANSAAKTAGKHGKVKHESPRARMQKLQKAVTKLERQIDAIEKRQVEIKQALELPETWNDGARSAELNKEMIVCQQRLLELTDAWEAEAAKLEAISS